MTADPAVLEAAGATALEVSIGPGAWGESAALDGLARVATAAALAVAELDSGSVSVSLRFTDDAELRDLNARFRGRDAATNVLSWPALALSAPLSADEIHKMRRHTPDEPLFVGDVALACETVTAEAAVAGTPLAAHRMHLIVHGVLHLLGWDHIKDEEAARMEARETAAMARLGWPDPYAEKAAGAVDRARPLDRE